MESLMSFSEYELSCPICLGTFNDPKTLPCGHTLCLEPCLQILVKTHSKNCPICQQRFSLPPSGKVEDFPTNYIAKNLIEISMKDLLDDIIIKNSELMQIYRKQVYYDNNNLSSRVACFESEECSTKGFLANQIQGFEEGSSYFSIFGDSEEDGDVWKGRNNFHQFYISDMTGSAVELPFENNTSDPHTVEGDIYKRENEMQQNKNNTCKDSSASPYKNVEEDHALPDEIKNKIESLTSKEDRKDDDKTHQYEPKIVSKYNTKDTTTSVVDFRNIDGTVIVTKYINDSERIQTCTIVPNDIKSEIKASSSRECSLIAVGNEFWITGENSELQLSESFNFPDKSSAVDIVPVPEGFLIILNDQSQLCLWTEEEGLKDINAQVPSQLKKELRADNSNVVPCKLCSKYVSVYDGVSKVTFYPWPLSSKKRINRFVTAPDNMPNASPAYIINNENGKSQILWWCQKDEETSCKWMVLEYTEMWTNQRTVAQG